MYLSIYFIITWVLLLYSYNHLSSLLVTVSSKYRKEWTPLTTDRWVTVVQRFTTNAFQIQWLTRLGEWSSHSTEICGAIVHTGVAWSVWSLGSFQIVPSMGTCLDYIDVVRTMLATGTAATSSGVVTPRYMRNCVCRFGIPLLMWVSRFMLICTGLLQVSRMNWDVLIIQIRRREPHFVEFKV